MIRMTGAEFKLFYFDKTIWQEDVYWDDGEILVDGKTLDDPKNVSDTAQVEVHGGEIYDGPPGVPVDMQDCIKWWRANQTSAEYQLRIPHDQLEAVQAALAAFGLAAVRVE